MPDQTASHPRPRVLVISQYYEPATGGGTIIDAVGAVTSLAEVADVRVLAGDRDLDGGDRLPVPAGGWHPHPGHRLPDVLVRYVGFGRRSLTDVRQAVREAEPDAVLAFSMWAPGSLATVLLRRVRLLPRGLRVVVAPAGELHEGALRQQAAKKAVVLRLGRALGLWRGVTWRASDADEAATITRELRRARVGVAPVLPAPALAAPPRRRDAEPGSVRLVSVGTVGFKKGLDVLIGHLSEAGRRGIPVHLDVFGAEIDGAFGQACRDRIRQLPAGVTVALHGLQGHDVIARALAGADAYALATRGENYGIAILEALDAGCPVLISDRTPWRGLEADGAGWDLPLDDGEGWVSAIRALADADEVRRQTWTAAALARAQRARTEAWADGAASWRALMALPEPTAGGGGRQVSGPGCSNDSIGSDTTAAPGSTS